jgi:hypothetical protein
LSYDPQQLFSGEFTTRDGSSDESVMSQFRDYWHRRLRWVAGRQNTGYDKLLLAANPFLIPFDCYLLRFPECKRGFLSEAG